MEEDMMDYGGKKRECKSFDPIIHVDGLAKAYVPFQQICRVYTCDDSLKHGTVFPELYKPYHMGKKEFKSYEKGSEAYE